MCRFTLVLLVLIAVILAGCSATSTQDDAASSSQDTASRYPTSVEQAEIPLHRYPLISSVSKAVAGKPFNVSIGLTSEPNQSGTVLIVDGKVVGGPMTLDLPHGEHWDLAVQLSASGFMVEGNKTSAIKKIVLRRGYDTSRADFSLVADASTHSNPLAERRAITATFYYQGRYLGQARKIITVGDSPSSDASSCYGWPDLAERSTQRFALHSRLSSEVAPMSVIYRRDYNQCDKHATLMQIFSPLLAPVLSPVVSFKLPEGWEAEVGEHLGNVQRPEVAENTIWQKILSLLNSYQQELDVDQQRRLLDVGTHLYEQYMPYEFHQAYSQLTTRLGDNFNSIQIYSDLHLIPFELMVPMQSTVSDSSPYLGLRQSVARWPVDLYSQKLPDHPQTNFLINTMSLMLAGDLSEASPFEKNEVEDFVDFPYAAKAVGQWNRYSSARDSSLRLNYSSVGTPDFDFVFHADWVHWLGHGSIRSRKSSLPSIELNNDNVFDSDTLQQLLDLWGESDQFWFVNSCYLGRQVGEGGVSGNWASLILNSGRVGFMGALYEIRSDIAADFSAQLYSNLDLLYDQENGGSFTEAVLKSKRATWDKYKHPSALAYAYYGAANLTYSLDY